MSRKRLLSAAALARCGCGLRGSLLEGTTVWKPSARGHPVMLDVLLKRKHVYGKGAVNLRGGCVHCSLKNTLSLNLSLFVPKGQTWVNENIYIMTNNTSNKSTVVML